MEKIALSSEPVLEIPFYYKCHHPLVDLHLRQIMGCSMLSLLPNSDFWSIPVFSVDTTDLKPNPVMVNGQKLFKEEKNLFELTITSVSSFEEGLAQIRAGIGRNQPVIISGTTYELPYSKDFHNSNYLNPPSTSSLGGDFIIKDHYLSVIGLGTDEVLLYDPIPNKFLNTISLEVLEKFWCGNVQFEVFNQARGFSKLVSYGTIHVAIHKNYQNEKLDTVALDVLNRVNTAFLEGKTRTSYSRLYLSGVALSNYVREAFNSYYSKTGEIPDSLGKCLFDMRWSRYYLRDFLHDLDRQLNIPLPEFTQEILVIIDLWEQVYKTFFSITRKKSQVNHTQVQKFNNVLAEAIGCENDFHYKTKEWLSKNGVNN